MEQTKAQAKERILKLKKAINQYRYEYHVQNRLEISEEALDSLKHELKKLEDEYPDLITADSPTQRVAGSALEKFKKIKHQNRMLSLEDVFSEEEFLEWTLRVKKLIPHKEFRLYAEPKFDGLAISLVYEDGVLQYGATRGDGLIGEDVTQNIKTMESIPLNLELHHALAPSAQKIIEHTISHGRVEVRGEAIITKKNFEAINRARKKEGLPLYANTRNLGAGSIRQLDPTITASRKLEFFAYDLLLPHDLSFHSEEHQVISALGFKTANHLEALCKNETEVFRARNKIGELREKLEYNIDGVVVSVDDRALFERLGVVGKAPRGAIAFKFAPMETTTVVEGIIVQVGRTGALTPVAVLRPVSIGGVTVSRATLHNEDEIKRLGLKIGDSVIVGRAGDVIPDVRKVLKELRTGKEKEFHMPTHCPVCGKKLEQEEVIRRCVNTKCPARSREGMYHFVSRKAFDIDGLGPKILDAFLDQGLIQDAADIFLLQEGDIAPLERFGEKSASNLVSAIALRRSISLDRFLYALGILHVGEETARDLAEYFGALSKIEKASEEDLNKIPNIGGVVAKSIYAWFRDAHNKGFLQRLLKSVTVENPKKKKSGKLKGKTFVFTGEMESMSRDAAKEKVRMLGADANESVSSQTSYVVVGSNPGSKYDRAKKLGVTILGEKEFLKMIK